MPTEMKTRKRNSGYKLYPRLYSDDFIVSSLDFKYFKGIPIPKSDFLTQMLRVYDAPLLVDRTIAKYLKVKLPTKKENL